MKSYTDFILLKQNLIKNIKNFKKFRANLKICAVVKANAYGMGVKNVSQIISSLVDFFAVANEIEGEELRKITEKPILIMNRIKTENIIDCLKQNLSLTISSFYELNQILSVCKSCNLIAKIHFKINTGMNRLGFKTLNEYKKTFNLAKKSKLIVIEGIYTHFLDGTNEKIANAQLNKFKMFLKCGKTSDTIVHASATNSAIKDKKYCFDMVRLGMLLFGYAEIKPPFKLLPVCKIVSKIVKIQDVKSGEYVGYGNGFLAEKDMKIGIIPLGYADGYLRSYSNRTEVVVNDNKCRVVGRICMDMFMIDISNVKCAELCDVIVLGNSKTQSITAEDLAVAGNTIPYEVLTNFRVDRFNYVVK